MRYFCSKHRLWVLVRTASTYSLESPREAVLTSTHNLCFEQKYEKYRSFLFENFQFLEMKFSIYLNRRVFVMYLVNLQPYSWFFFQYEDGELVDTSTTCQSVLFCIFYTCSESESDLTFLLFVILLKKNDKVFFTNLHFRCARSTPNDEIMDGINQNSWSECWLFTTNCFQIWDWLKRVKRITRIIHLVLSGQLCNVMTCNECSFCAFAFTC